MRHLSALAMFFVLFSLFSSRPAGAQTATDTVPGQARFVRKLTATLCQRIADSARARPFEQLTPQRADALFMKLMITAMSEQATDFGTLMGEAEQRKLSPNQLGQLVGQATVLQLSTTCPSSMALVMRTSSAQRIVGAKGQRINDISAKERAILQPMADSACVQLAAEDARRPFKQLPAPVRKQEMSRVLQTLMVRNMPALLQLYSAEQLADQAQMEVVGIKLAGLMMTQCPTYLIMLGQDAASQKAAAKAAAVPKASAAGKASKKPAAKAPIKTGQKNGPKK